MNMARSVNYISFSSGSIGGLAYVGAWRALEEAGMADSLKGFSGCSIGSIMALLVSIGYTSEELTTIVYNLKYKRLSTIQIFRIFENYGLETGEKIMELLGKLVLRKVGQKALTFNEHWRITGKKLWIAVSCVEDDRVEYFSVDNQPDMDVLLAVRMSIAMPIIFSAVKWKGKTYVDGGFQDPLPVSVLPPAETLAFKVRNENAGQKTGDATSDADSGVQFMSYVYQIIFSAYKRLHYNHEPIYKKYNIIHLDTDVMSMSLNLRRSSRMRLVHQGYVTAMARLKDGNGRKAGL